MKTNATEKMLRDVKNMDSSGIPSAEKGTMLSVAVSVHPTASMECSTLEFPVRRIPMGELLEFLSPARLLKNMTLVSAILLVPMAMTVLVLFAGKTAPTESMSVELSVLMEKMDALSQYRKSW